MEIGDTITLHGKTMAGRTKIANEGDKFRIVGKDSPLCLSSKPALLLESVQSGKLRWILCEADTHFEIVS